MFLNITPFFQKAVLVSSVLMILVPASMVWGEPPENRFQSLQRRLVADGFNVKYITQLYQSDQVDFDIKGISLFFRHQEGKLNYDQFLSDKYIERAQHYLLAHESAFQQAEMNSGVDRQVIAAIILVETKLGQYLGERAVLNTLSTMASLEDTITREYFWSNLPEERRLSRKEFDDKADRKSSWAYKELKAFLTYTGKENIDPFSPTGSYAGALGICQFMPSNILIFGQDGNGDGRINLFDHSDAIASIAKYLKNYGWYPGIQREDAYKVVLHYNRSSYYANTVLKVAERLKG